MMLAHRRAANPSQRRRAIGAVLAGLLLVGIILGVRVASGIVFAREGDTDGKAEADMHRFYELIREPTRGRYDPARAASAARRDVLGCHTPP